MKHVKEVHLTQALQHATHVHGHGAHALDDGDVTEAPQDIPPGFQNVSPYTPANPYTDWNQETGAPPANWYPPVDVVGVPPGDGYGSGPDAP